MHRIRFDSQPASCVRVNCLTLQASLGLVTTTFRYCAAGPRGIAVMIIIVLGHTHDGRWLFYGYYYRYFHTLTLPGMQVYSN